MVKLECENQLFVCSVVLEDAWRRRHKKCSKLHRKERKTKAWQTWVEQNKYERSLIVDEHDVDQARRLCIACANLDYKAMCNFAWNDDLQHQNGSTKSADYRYFAKLELVPDPVRDFDCPMCAFWYACRPTERRYSNAAYNSAGPPPPFDGFDIVACPFAGRSEARTLKHRYRNIVQTYFQIRRRNNQRSLVDYRRGQIFCRPFRCTDVPAKWVIMPNLLSEQFDHASVQRWIYRCLVNHRKCNELQEVKRCRLGALDGIDVQENRVVRISNYTQYLALSYVWGSTSSLEQPSSQIPMVGKACDLSLAPKTVREAMCITRSLGFRFLWVDRYCLSQRPDDRADGIARMDAVYGAAALTICAVTNRDTNDGIPGSGETKRKPQLRIRVGDISLMYRQDNLEEMLPYSPWAQRGWTFQEAVLPARRLLFLEDRVHFECATTSYDETISPLDVFELETSQKDLYHGQLRFATLYLPLRPFLKKPSSTNLVNEDNLMRYQKLITDYSHRSLTYDSDALNAFQGVISHMICAKTAFHHFWAMPVQYLNTKGALWRLSHNPAYKDDELECEVRSQLVRNLIWWRNEQHLQKPMRRRPEFPSWSWLGWAGAIKFLPVQPSRQSWRNVVRTIDLEYDVHAISAPSDFAYPRALWIQTQYMRFSHVPLWRLRKKSSALKHYAQRQNCKRIQTHRSLRQDTVMLLIWFRSLSKGTQEVCYLAILPEASHWMRVGCGFFTFETQAEMNDFGFESWPQGKFRIC